MYFRLLEAVRIVSLVNQAPGLPGLPSRATVIYICRCEGQHLLEIYARQVLICTIKMDKSATHKGLFIFKSSLYMHEKPTNLTSPP